MLFILNVQKNFNRAYVSIYVIELSKCHQQIASDYFHLEGKSYLLTVDRFSNWPDLREAPAHSFQSGAPGLIKANRELFAKFGVPEELSSDEGPEYIAEDFKDFL